MASVKGLQTGRVIQLEGDPGKQFRVLVYIAAIHKTGEKGSWITMASPDAGDSRGLFFLPEINDEVVVGFINDDPARAVMLGMLYGAEKKPPLPARNDNHQKGIFTRSKLRIQFSDDTKTITIDTPAGNSIALDENGSKVVIKDQHHNTITMQSTGIRLESTQQVEIKAAGNLLLSAGASINIKASTISIESAASLIMKAASTKLSAAGITEIVGSLVKIN
ncbi:MAG: phage baseplate assembly protein V [Chitinophagaceae bacterium]